MNIGIMYAGDAQISGLLYPITNGNVEILHSTISQSSIEKISKFKIYDREHIFHFSNNFDDLQNADIKVAVFQYEYFEQAQRLVEQFTDLVDKIIITRTNGESLPEHEFHHVYKTLSNPKVFWISSAALGNTQNDRIIIDIFINLYYFYNGFGFYYLNYYPSEKKEKFIGTYNRHVNYKPERYDLIKHFRENIVDDIEIFDVEESFYTNVGGNILDRWNWQQMHITSYLDYNTTVANILFDTATDGPSKNNTFILNEKILKGIIFQKANIFFIYLGTIEAMNWAIQKGFWFLNQEFYDSSKATPGDVIKSAIKTIEFLKNLKEELKTNDAVYKFLLDKYKHKLEQSVNSFNHLLNNCEYKEQLIKLLTEKGN